MKIQYMSDLHLEGALIDLDNKDKADLLILAGDITTSKSYKSHLDFFKKCSDNWERVVHVCGNHEYYRGDIEETQEELKEFFEGNFTNVRTLQNETIDLGDYQLFGATLWTDANEGDPVTSGVLSEGMNDYRLIQRKSKRHWRLRVSDTVELHQASVEALQEALRASGGKPTIVVTHHAPSYKSTNIKYGGDYHMNGGYRSDLEWLMEPVGGLVGYNIPFWFHGHMHDSVDYTVGKTRVLSNPRGYLLVGRDGKRYTENEFFDPDKVVEL